MAKRHPYTQMTKKHLETKMNMVVGITEKWNPMVGAMIVDQRIPCPECRTVVVTRKPAGIRQDLFGFADLIAFNPQRPDVVLVQCTSGTNHAARKKKILENSIARDWVLSDHRSILLCTWSKYCPKKKDGTKGKAERWKPRIEVLTITDFNGDKEPF